MLESSGRLKVSDDRAPESGSILQTLTVLPISMPTYTIDRSLGSQSMCRGPPPAGSPCAATSTSLPHMSTVY